MNTYFVVCGVILNTLFLLAIVYFVDDELGARNTNKEMRKKETQKQKN